MKNKSTAIILAAIILLSITSFVQAARNNDTGRGDTSGVGKAEDSGPLVQGMGQKQAVATPQSQPKIQLKNQIETKNRGEDSQLKVETQEQTQEETEMNTGAGNTKKESPRSEVAQEKMSIVAKHVEELLTNRTMKGGIGEQVRVVATQQKQAQEAVESQLHLVENRKGLLKSLIGPDFKALRDVENQIEQNQMRIAQLEELKTQLTNQSDITMIEETIQALTEQNTQLQDTVTTETQTKSMFGWLFRYFAK